MYKLLLGASCQNSSQLCWEMLTETFVSPAVSGLQMGYQELGTAETLTVLFARKRQHKLLHITCSPGEWGQPHSSSLLPRPEQSPFINQPAELSSPVTGAGKAQAKNKKFRLNKKKLCRNWRTTSKAEGWSGCRWVLKKKRKNWIWVFQCSKLVWLLEQVQVPLRASLF